MFLREETSNSVYMFLSTIIDFLFTLVQGAKRKRGVGRRRTRLWIGTLFVRTVYICIYSYFYLYIYIYARYKYTCRTPHFRSGYFVRVEFLIVVFGVMYTKNPSCSFWVLYASRNSGFRVECCLCVE